MSWTLAAAKDRLSEVVRRAQAEGPQTISIRGREAAVVLSKQEFDSLSQSERKGDFVEFLLSGSSWEGVDLERTGGFNRDIEL